MKQTSIFRGAATALITPLTPDGIDYAQFRRLIDWQIGEGIDALVIAGTTGEGSTLTDAEHRESIRFAVETAEHRVPVIAGTGSNDTDYAIDLTRYACSVGADAMLVVTPFYNKATQKGLIRMYNAIADASDKPLILYNVPSRTGLSFTPETYRVLSRHPNINGIKEASGDFSLLAETMALCGEDLNVWSGNDDHTVPMMAMGAKGLISVASNLAPKPIIELTHSYLRGDTERARQLQLAYAPLIRALFSQVNPIPIKAAMREAGLDSGALRLPLCEMDEGPLNALRRTMKITGLLH